MRRQYEDHEHDATYLSRDRLKEAAHAYDLIAEVSRETGSSTYTLAGIVRGWAVRERQAAKSVSLDKLFDEYLAARSGSTTELYRSRLGWCKQHMSGLGWHMVSNITPADLESVLKNKCPSTRNSFLSYLRAMFNWGVKRSYLKENPVEKIEFASIKRSEVQIYTPDEVQKLLDDALENDLGLLPYLVLTLFSGVRPHGEVTRVEWVDIKWQDRVVKLSAGITKKGRARFPKLSDNAVEWLEAYRQCGGEMTGPIVKYSRKQLQARRRANLKRSGVKAIQNGSRHSYCSYHLAEFNDINGLVLQSGHANTQTLWNHYYQSALKEDAARYWSVTPKTVASNVLAFTA